jgi:hypothetical protein
MCGGCPPFHIPSLPAACTPIVVNSVPTMTPSMKFRIAASVERSPCLFFTLTLELVLSQVHRRIVIDPTMDTIEDRELVRMLPSRRSKVVALTLFQPLC